MNQPRVPCHPMHPVPIPSISLLLCALSIAVTGCRDADADASARPLVVSKAHGRLEVELLLEGGSQEENKEAMTVLAARFKELGDSLGLARTIVSTRGEGIALELSARVGPDCVQREVTRVAARLAAVAIRRGEFALHVLPPKTRADRALPVIQRKVGPDISVTHRAGQVSAFELAGSDLVYATSRLRDWEPLAGYRLLIQPVRSSLSVAYLYRARPNLGTENIEVATSVSEQKLLHLQFNSAGRSRLEALTEASAGSVLLARIDDELVDASVISGPIRTGRLVLTPTLHPGAVRRYAAFVNAGALPRALKVVSRSAGCRRRAEVE